jgi:hypothetical protein
MSRTGWMAAMVLGLMLALGGPAMAQDNQPAGGRGNRGNFDPAQMRERMMTRLKEQLGANDEEWKVLAPKVEKVMTAQTNSRGGGGFGGGRGGRGGGGGGDNAPQTPVAKASAELRAALEANAPAEEIAKKLAAYRDARNKAREELAAAQKELKELLTAKQEAQLVVSGTLE